MCLENILRVRLRSLSYLTHVFLAIIKTFLFALHFFVSISLTCPSNYHHQYYQTSSTALPFHGRRDSQVSFIHTRLYKRCPHVQVHRTTSKSPISKREIHPLSSFTNCSIAAYSQATPELSEADASKAKDPRIKAPLTILPKKASHPIILPF